MTAKKELNISAIKEGTVIDHIPPEAVFQVADILKLDKIQDAVIVASNLKSKAMGRKGIVKISGKMLSKEEVNKIAIVAPNASVNIIKDYSVTKKLQVALIDEIRNSIRCSNPNCITNVENHPTLFYVIEKEPLKVKCHYCERYMDKKFIKIV